MSKIQSLAIRFCLVGFVHQANAQCSGEFSSFYQPQPVSISYLGGCSSAPFVGDGSYVSTYVAPPVSNMYPTSVANISAPQSFPIASQPLPAPSIAQPAFFPSPAPSFNSFAPAPVYPTAFNAPSLMPVSAPAAFNSGFNSVAAPSCANGQCQFR